VIAVPFPSFVGLKDFSMKHRPEKMRARNSGANRQIRKISPQENDCEGADEASSPHERKAPKCAH
jgi:hypothetical protein